MNGYNGSYCFKSKQYLLHYDKETDGINISNFLVVSDHRQYSFKSIEMSSCLSLYESLLNISQ